MINVSADQREKLRGIEFHLKGNIIGQDEVIDAILPRLKAGELGFASPDRPKAGLLFLGPTGVGKTELAKCVAAYLFGKNKLLRLDMSEYQNQSSLSLLLGKNQCDQGYFGQRFDEVEGRGVLLLDEIEKAHPRILDLLLQILDEGHLTLANRTTLDLKGFYVVMTSNIGSNAILGSKQSSRATRTRFIEAQAQAHLRPELFARIDQVAVFDALDFQCQLKIANRMIDREVRRLGALGIEVVIDDEARSSLATRGYSAKLGLRPMRRAVEEHLAIATVQAMSAPGTGERKESGSGSLS